MTTSTAQPSGPDLFVMCFQDHRNDFPKGGPVFFCLHPHRQVYVLSRSRRPAEFTVDDLAAFGARMGSELDSYTVKPVASVRVEERGDRAALKGLGLNFRVVEITREHDFTLEDVMVSLDGEKQRTSWLGESVHHAPDVHAETAGWATPPPGVLTPVAGLQAAVADTQQRPADPFETTPAPSLPAPQLCPWSPAQN